MFAKFFRPVGMTILIVILLSGISIVANADTGRLTYTVGPVSTYDFAPGEVIYVNIKFIRVNNDGTDGANVSTLFQIFSESDIDVTGGGSVVPGSLIDNGNLSGGGWTFKMKAPTVSVTDFTFTIPDNAFAGETLEQKPAPTYTVNKTISMETDVTDMTTFNASQPIEINLTFKQGSSFYDIYDLPAGGKKRTANYDSSNGNVEMLDQENISFSWGESIGFHYLNNANEIHVDNPNFLGLMDNDIITQNGVVTNETNAVSKFRPVTAHSWVGADKVVNNMALSTGKYRLTINLPNLSDLDIPFEVRVQHGNLESFVGDRKFWGLPMVFKDFSLDGSVTLSLETNIQMTDSNGKTFELIDGTNHYSGEGYYEAIKQFMKEMFPMDTNSPWYAPDNDKYWYGPTIVTRQFLPEKPSGKIVISYVNNGNRPNGLPANAFEPIEISFFYP